MSSCPIPAGQSPIPPCLSEDAAALQAPLPLGPIKPELGCRPLPRPPPPLAVLRRRPRPPVPADLRLVFFPVRPGPGDDGDAGRPRSRLVVISPRARRPALAPPLRAQPRALLTRSASPPDRTPRWTSQCRKTPVVTARAQAPPRPFPVPSCAALIGRSSISACLACNTPGGCRAMCGEVPPACALLSGERGRRGSLRLSVICCPSCFPVNILSLGSGIFFRLCLTVISGG